MNTPDPAVETYVVDLAAIRRPPAHTWIYDAFRISDDLWEGRALYADEITALNQAAADYAEEEFGDNPVPDGVLVWRKRSNGDWRLYDTTQDKYVNRADTEIVIRRTGVYLGTALDAFPTAATQDRPNQERS